MKTNSFYLRILLLVVALTTAVAFVFSRPKNNVTETWLPSSFNPAPRGHKALYLTLEKLHWPVQRWHRSYRELTGHDQLMILTRDVHQRKTPFSPEEIHQLQQWVQAGNQLFLLGDFQTWPDTQPLLQNLGFAVTPELSPARKLARRGPEIRREESPDLVLTPSELTADGALTISSCPPLPNPPSHSQILWRDEKGQPYAIRIPMGAGQLTWFASASIINDRQISKNLSTLLPLWFKANGPMPVAIYFEERHHGFPSTYALRDLWQQPGLRLAGGQLLLGLLVLLVSSLQRFGPVLPLRPEAQRSSLEFVTSMGRLYRRANLRNHIVQHLYEETRLRVLAKFNLPSQTPPKLVAEQLEQAFPHLPRWKKLAERFELKQSPAGLPPGGWLKTAQDLIQIKREMI